VLSTFEHVGELLDRVTRLAREEPSAFSRERPDLSAYEARMLLALVDRLRARMLDALGLLGVAPPAPTVSARWSAITAIGFADIALAELSETSLRGYGRLDPATAAVLAGLVGDLRALVERATTLLRAKPRAELAERIATVPEPAGQVLREVLDIADAHGLLDVYGYLEAIAERATSPVADVGVFGRVNSGKSSLINALVGAPLVPVGATPATAVAVRIERGEPRLRAHYADGRVEELALDELPELATERANPGNRKGVSWLDVHVPQAPEGVRLIDTAGVVAAPTLTSASTYSWLPRCNVALVLAAAGTAAGVEERSLVRSLEAAGVEFVVLLSKCDLVAETERTQALSYVRAELSGSLARPVIEVHPVSTAEGAHQGLEWLRHGVLEPLVAERGRSVRDLLDRRLHHLVDLVEASLAGRSARALEESLALRRTLGDAAPEVERLTGELAGSGPALVEACAEVVSAAWRHRRSAAAALREVMIACLNDALARVRGQVESARRTAIEELAPEGAGLPPLPDPSALAGLDELRPPKLLAGPLRSVAAKRRVRRLAPVLDDLLRSYAEKLRRWSDASLDQATELAGGSASLEGGERSLGHLHRILDSSPGREDSA
jgi:GTP-binding protein EngB required for normal cell division